MSTKYNVPFAAPYFGATWRTIVVQTARLCGIRQPTAVCAGDFHILFHNFCEDRFRRDGDVT
jgi:hypothetical protein